MTAEGMPQYFGKDLEAMSFARNYHDWILSEIEPFLGGSVAEVGAGVGSFSSLLLGKDIDRLVAFEPSENMFPLLEQTLSKDSRAECINDFFGAAAAGDAFDSILYINVLEHIEDDAAELINAHAALRDGGHVLIFVPALPWLFSDLDRQVGHFRRYIKRELMERVEQAGLTVAKARYFDIAGILPWYVSFVLLKNSIGSSSVTLYDRLVVPIMRVMEGLVPPPIGKNVLLIARKEEKHG